jgi:hypothetical protein
MAHAGSNGKGVASGAPKRRPESYMGWFWSVPDKSHCKNGQNPV